MTTAANAAVVFREGIADSIVGEHITVMRYDSNGQLDYRLEAKQELRKLKIKQTELMNIDSARLDRLQYIDGIFIKSPLRLSFETAKSGAGQIILFNVTGQLDGQQIKAQEAKYNIGRNEIIFTKIRYLKNLGFSQKQHLRYVIPDIAPSLMIKH